MRRGARLKGGGRETETQQNACTLEEGPPQNESAVGHRGAGTPNCQAAVARLGGAEPCFPLCLTLGKGPAKARL